MAILYVGFNLPLKLRQGSCTIEVQKLQYRSPVYSGCGRGPRVFVPKHCWKCHVQVGGALVRVRQLGPTKRSAFIRVPLGR